MSNIIRAGAPSQAAVDQVKELAQLVSSHALDAVHVGADAPGRLQRAGAAANALTHLINAGVLDGALDKDALAALEKLAQQLQAVSGRVEASHKDPALKELAQNVAADVRTASGALDLSAEAARDAGARAAVIAQGGAAAELLKTLESHGFSLKARPGGTFEIGGMLGVLTPDQPGALQSPPPARSPQQAMLTAWNMMSAPGNAIRQDGQTKVWDLAEQKFVPGALDASKTAFEPKASP